MAGTTHATPEPSNNDCPMHERYNMTCGTCNGLFDRYGNPQPDSSEVGAQGRFENFLGVTAYDDPKKHEALKALVQQVCLEAVGDMETPEEPSDEYHRIAAKVRNQLRAEIRQNIKRLVGEK